MWYMLYISRIRDLVAHGNIQTFFLSLFCDFTVKYQAKDRILALSDVMREVV